MFQKQFASCELYFSCFRLTFVPTQLFLSWALSFGVKSSLATLMYSWLPTHLIILSDKIKLIYVMNRRLNLPLYEMTDGRYEIDYSLCEMIILHNGCGICFITCPDDVKRSFDINQAIDWRLSNDRLTACGKVRERTSYWIAIAYGSSCTLYKRCFLNY